MRILNMHSLMFEINSIVNEGIDWRNLCIFRCCMSAGNIAVRQQRKKEY